MTDRIVRIPDFILTERRGLFSGYCPCGFQKLDKPTPLAVEVLMNEHMRIVHPLASGDVQGGDDA